MTHYITLHYITSHYITLHYITLHHITLHYITSHHITSHHITSVNLNRHYVTETLNIFFHADREKIIYSACVVLGSALLLNSILSDSTLFYSIPFFTSLFYSIQVFSIQFCSIQFGMDGDMNTITLVSHTKYSYVIIKADETVEQSSKVMIAEQRKVESMNEPMRTGCCCT